MAKSKLPLLGFTLVLFAVAGIFLFIYSKNKQYISPNILSLTQPLRTFPALVEKIENNTLTLSLPNTQPTQAETKIIYKAMISPKTSISQLTQTGLSINDIREGQIVSVSTDSDLRTLKGNSFEATTIILFPIKTTLNGTITNIDKDIITVKIDSQATPLQNEYKVSITGKTEIVELTASPPSKTEKVPVGPKSVKINQSDLKVNMMVNIYTGEDINSGKPLTAIKIERLVPLALIGLPSATPTSTILVQ